MAAQVKFLVLLLSLVSGCAAYRETGPWAPDTFRAGMKRDRETGRWQDEVGLSWRLK